MTRFIEFELYWEEARDSRQRISINPMQMASFRGEERRHAYGGYSQVTVIVMADGTEHAVNESYDAARRRLHDWARAGEVRT